MAASFKVNINHPGSIADLISLARSYVKYNLSVLNDRTHHRDVVNEDGSVTSNPYTEDEVDGLNGARLNKAVRLIQRNSFERDALAYDMQAAEAAFINPVSGRGDRTTIGDSID